MSMALALVAVPGPAFAAVEADPQLLRWVRRRALLDWSTTLRGYILEPDACKPDDPRRMAQVDDLGLRPEDLVLVDYLAVSRTLDAAAPRPPASDVNAERVQASLAGGAQGPLVLDGVPGAVDEGDRRRVLIRQRSSTSGAGRRRSIVCGLARRCAACGRGRGS